jgi:Tfp pilus assembly protein PilZ
MFIATDEPLPEQTILKVTFQLAPGERIYEMQGRVIWANRPEDEHVRTPGMGIEFTNPAACGDLARDLEGLPADRQSEP